MKKKIIKDLNKVERNLLFLESALTIQSKPCQYVWQALPIEKNIKFLLDLIKKEAENLNIDQVEHIFSLLRRFIIIWKKYFINHPLRPLINTK